VTAPRTAPPPLGEPALARWYALAVGAALVVLGLLGFVDNPLVGDPGSSPLMVTGTVHDMIHLATGFLGLYIAFALVGRAQADAVIAFGVLYLVFLLLTIVSPNLFGILGPSPGYNVNGLGHVVHLAIGLVSIGVGLIARRELAAVRST
jgi:hypothetical protein